MGESIPAKPRIPDVCPAKFSARKDVHCPALSQAAPYFSHSVSAALSHRKPYLISLSKGKILLYYTISLSNNKTGSLF